MQASSISWTGIPDLCMNHVNGHPAVYWTIRKIFECFDDADVTVIAPEFDAAGLLNELRTHFGDKKFHILYSHNTSPLKRIIEATRHLEDDDYFVRVDGLHFWFDSTLTAAMLSEARAKSLDCVKAPDDFPAQLSSEVFKVEAIRKAARMLAEFAPDSASRFEIHPKFFIQSQRSHFSTEIYDNLPIYSDAYLEECRTQARSIYIAPRIDIGETRVPAGDSISFHYELAKHYIRPSDKVLDVASGLGFGGATIASVAAQVVCADLDENAVEEGTKKFSKITNMSFQRQDVTRMDFPDNEFDAVLSFETVEHVDEIRFFEEIKRVLKPGGVALISTPQNRLGKIPITAEHVKEFSLEEISDIASRHLEVKDIIGIKAGTIWFEGDPRGSNTFMVARKPH